jgi:S-DNA-T family DNA segregation ATPase FtsK/SpoIIIE
LVRCIRAQRSTGELRAIRPLPSVPRVTATIEFVRPAPGSAPAAPVAGDVPMDAPPPVPRVVATGLLVRLMPLLTLLATAGMVVVLVRSGAGVAHNPMFLVFPIVLAASAVTTMTQAGGGRQRTAELDTDRDRYLSYLETLGSQLVEAAEAQRKWLLWCHPAPGSLWTLTGGPRMWERRSDAPEFGRIRIGQGSVPAAQLPVGATPGSEGEPDPVTATAARRFLRAHSWVSGAPVTVGIDTTAAITIDGDLAAARALIRAMLCQLTALHSPADVRLVAVVNEAGAEVWDWLKWLPHHQHPVVVDNGGPLRMVYSSMTGALGAVRIGCHIVLLVDGVPIEENQYKASTGTTVLEIGGTGIAAMRRGGHRFRLTPSRLIVTDPDGANAAEAIPDLMTPDEAMTFARRLAAYHPGDGTAGAGSWCDLIGIANVGQISPNTLWNNPDGQRLAVPIGVTARGEAIELDIKEAAERGMGPHGLCVGATGSGKSELLRAVALGMIARHSPEALNLILVDFKGGATFLDLDRTNHVAAVVTNLADEAHLVERLRDALTGEIIRRQQILRTAGNLASTADYARARRAGRPLPALPALFVIVDEFSELLSQHPDFVDVFVAIGRLGRSLGIHLLLASQRLDEGRLRGLEAHLSYRICLKTLSAAESRAAIGVPDAYQLPATPGAAYLKVGPAEPVRFQTAFVSGPIGTDIAVRHVETGAAVPMLFTARPMGPVGALPAESDWAAPRHTLLDSVLDALAGRGPVAHRVWLPPLPASPTLDAVIAEFGKGTDLAVPVGVVDRTIEQRRAPMVVDLSGSAGNVALVGAPQSGKSTAVRTLVTALALGHGARRIQVYCLDFGGGALSPLADLPQVGSVAGRLEVDLVRRTVTEIAAVLRRREKLFRDLGVQSIVDYRRRLAGDPCFPPTADVDPVGDVFLVVDGWNVLRQELDGLETSITAIAAEGLSFGVHVVLTASRWADLRPALKDQIGTRIELRLGDPADSEIDRKRSRQVPQGIPGRGLAPDGMPLVIATPVIGGTLAVADDGGLYAPAIALLPDLVVEADLVRGAGPQHRGLILGVDETRLGTVALDFTAQPHLLILGDPHCGKTATLRTLCHEIARTEGDDAAQLFLVDPRRTLLGEIAADRLAGYAASPAAVAGQLPELVAMLRGRLPGAAVTARQLRDRSWWSGPDVYLVVDDYDLVATAAGNPLTPILDILPHATDIGLHMVIARRSGGAARALYEPVLAAIRDLGAMALQMSVAGDEGPLLAPTRPRPLPPGRAVLTTRACGDQIVQVAWRAPA